MPGRFTSPLCPRCGLEPETASHRHLLCEHVCQAWEWVRYLILSLDSLLSAYSDKELLHLEYPKGLRENAILWLIGNFVELVESEVVLKNHKLNSSSIKGLFKQKKQRARYMAMPELGLIPGLDFDQQGIG